MVLKIVKNQAIGPTFEFKINFTSARWQAVHMKNTQEFSLTTILTGANRMMQ